MDRNAQIEGLQPATAGVALFEAFSNVIKHAIPGADRPAFDEQPSLLKCPSDLLVAWHFADAGPTSTIPQHHDVAREERPVRAAEIEQHAIVARDGDHPHLCDERRAERWGRC
jgi:hypothetical protein